MLSNSEFIVMLNHAASDRDQLAKLYIVVSHKEADAMASQYSFMMIRTSSLKSFFRLTVPCGWQCFTESTVQTI